MRISENIEKKTLRRLTFNEFQGVDFGKRGDLRLARYSSNLLFDENRVRKRKGWREIKRFEGEINGIFEISLKGYDGILVYAGKRFYFDDGTGYRDITLSGGDKKADLDRLISRTITLFPHQDKYYVVGAGDYLVLGDFGNGLQIRRVEENDCYVPTTTIGIPSIVGSFYKAVDLDENSRGIYYVKDGDSYQQVILDGETDVWSQNESYYNLVASSSVSSEKLEEGNILNGYRKNTLFGSNENTSEYQLDVSEIDSDSKTEVNVKTILNGEEVEFDLTEKEAGTTSRCPTIGDVLKGKTLVFTENQNVVETSVLRNGEGVKGRQVIKGKGLDVYWLATGADALKWNECSLIFRYASGDSHESVIVATATRPNTYSPYSITYRNESITLDLFDYTITYFDDVAGIKDRLRADLTDFERDLVDVEQNVLGRIDHSTGRISFDLPLPSPDYSPNITVKFKSHYYLDADAINECAFGCFFGVDGNGDRLFLSGNSNYPNYDFCSESNDPTYFPYDGVSVFGESSSPVSGYLRLSDSTQAILKKKSKHDATIFVRKGRWVTRSVSVGNKNFSTIKAEFYLVGSYVAEGCVNPFCTSYIGSEPVFLSENGIFALRTSENKATESRYTVERGAYIDDHLLGLNKDKAHVLEYKGKYMLFIDDKVFLTTSERYKTEGIKQYLFWRLDNVPSSAVGVVDNNLLLGTSDGRLLEFWEGYKDVTLEKMQAGDFSFTADSSVVEISENIPIDKDCKVRFNGHVYMKLYSDCVVRDGKVTGVSPKTAERTVYADNVGNSGLSVNVPYKIVNVDPAEGTFELKGEDVISLVEGGFDLYVDLFGVDLEVENMTYTLDESANDVMTLRYGEDTVVISPYNEEMPLNLTADIRKEVPVCAEWQSQETDLGDPSQLKTIKGIGIDVGDGACGKITIMCFGGTDNKTDLESTGKLRLTGANFAKIGFNGDLTKNYNVKANVKDVNYFRFVVWSEDDKPFELLSVYFEYVYSRKNRGLR